MILDEIVGYDAFFQQQISHFDQDEFGKNTDEYDSQINRVLEEEKKEVVDDRLDEEGSDFDEDEDFDAGSENIDSETESDNDDETDRSNNQSGGKFSEETKSYLKGIYTDSQDIFVKKRGDGRLFRIFTRFNNNKKEYEVLNLTQIKALILSNPLDTVTNVSPKGLEKIFSFDRRFLSDNSVKILPDGSIITTRAFRMQKFRAGQSNKRLDRKSEDKRIKAIIEHLKYQEGSYNLSVDNNKPEKITIKEIISKKIDSNGNITNVKFSFFIKSVEHDFFEKNSCAQEFRRRGYRFNKNSQKNITTVQSPFEGSDSPALFTTNTPAASMVEKRCSSRKSAPPERFVPS